MSRLSRHLTAGLLCSLLSAAGGSVQARDLGSQEPLRITLVSLARQSAHPGSDSALKLSVRRAWASDSQAQLCALTLDASGAPVLEGGRFQMRRIQFLRQQGQWRVQHSETRWLPAGGSLDAICPKSGTSASPPTQLAQSGSGDINVALAEMERRPPTAGLPGSLRDLRAEATCPIKPEAPTNVADWKPGRIEAQGRTHLFDAPDHACRMGKHLVQHDKVRIGPTQGAWVQVQYTHPITQVVTVGWLPGQKAIAVDTHLASQAR